ncbi:MAG: pilus assembly protein CpaE [Actinobacteria bacterium]|nr:pilus assembly protein CpaE [Actinomycetota bacterium]
MISVGLARRLRDGGLRWDPQRGDRFVVVDRGMDEDIFVLSDMTIEVHKFPDGDLIGFNGTTEWALDSIDPKHSVWLPSESQLRERLGATLVSLRRVETGWQVKCRVGQRELSAIRDDAAEAYGACLLHLVTGEYVPEVVPVD